MICANCHIEMVRERVGVELVKMATFGPIAVHLCDIDKCPECGARLVTGVAPGASAWGLKECREYLRNIPYDNQLAYWADEGERRATSIEALPPGLKADAAR